MLAKTLEKELGYETKVIYKDWPKDLASYEGADCVVMYSDGGGGHPVNGLLDTMDAVAKKGVGIVCIHYAVEIPKGKAGDCFLDWIGGYFEANYSVNPHWTANYEKLPEHPITRGVQPFKIDDEWYYHMRFRPEMKGVTPILTALPPKETLNRGDGPHSGNPDVRRDVLEKKEPQHMAWAAERDGNGRGFGFTGGHNHWNWGDDNFRRLVLNAIIWCAHGEVPKEGVGGKPVTFEQLLEDQDEQKPANLNAEQIIKKYNLKASGEAPKSGRAVARERYFVAADASRDAASAVAGLDVAEGLEATLFASEPEISNITSIDIDHLGRVWACEVKNYRKWNNSRPEGDRILVLEDTNGDGKSDKTTVFYQGRDIDSAHGVCVLGNKVIVSANDKVQIFYDDDGDLKSDRKETMFTGISGTQHDHGIHAFQFGPDGKLYFNFGNSGNQIKDKDGKPIVDMAGNVVKAGRKPYQEGMVFRCNLDGSEFETLGWNFRNNWEVHRRFVRHHLAERQRRRRQQGGPHQLRDGVRQLRLQGRAHRRGLEPAANQPGERDSRSALAPERSRRGAQLAAHRRGLAHAASCVYEGTLLPKVFHGPGDSLRCRPERVPRLSGHQRRRWLQGRQS